MYKPKKNKVVFVDPIIQFDSKELEPERELYVAVIKRAILDLANIGNKVLHNKAKGWFFCSVGVTCDNFEFICENANINANSLRTYAYEVTEKIKEDPKYKYKLYYIKSDDERNEGCQ